MPIFLNNVHQQNCGSEQAQNILHLKQVGFLFCFVFLDSIWDESKKLLILYYCVEGGNLFPGVTMINIAFGTKIRGKIIVFFFRDIIII